MQNNLPKWFMPLIMALAIIGFLDATFLTVEHYLNATPPCSILSGCEEVTTSKYNQIFGIPVALLGSLYYGYVIVMSILFLDLKKNIFLSLITYGSIVAFLFSMWFLYAQVFLIGAICIYCMASVITSSSIFGLSIYRERLMYNIKHEQNP